MTASHAISPYNHFGVAPTLPYTPPPFRPLSLSMSFTEAASAFLDSRTAPVTPSRVQYIGKGTFKDYAKKLKALGIFFGSFRLEEINLGHLIEYQRARSTGDGFTRKLGKVVVQSPAGAAKINAELGLLQRLLKQTFGAIPKRTSWEEANRPPDLRLTAFAQNLAQIETFYLPFQTVDADIPRALSPQEQDHFMKVASSNPEWYPIWWYSLAAVHLTFSSDEMRTIRIGDINLTHQIVGVNRRYGKNKFRRRDVPISDGACIWALTRLIERARTLGGGEPHHFLFPGRMVRNVFDPDTHMSETGLRKPFEAVRAAAEVPWFQLNGWRHTAITRLAEAGVPIATIMQRAGHVTSKMSEHYTHISEQAGRMAIAGAANRKPVISVQASKLRRGIVGY
jgi:integrase